MSSCTAGRCKQETAVLWWDGEGEWGPGAYLCPGTLPDTDYPVLVGVEHLPYFPHGLGVCGGGGEVAIQIQAPKQASPPVVALSSVW